MGAGSKPKNAELVYFVRGEASGLIKIGVARDVFRRLRALQVGSPDRLILMGVMRPDDPCHVEGHLHWFFRADHSHGEWFRPSAAILAYITAQAVDADLDDQCRLWAIALGYSWRVHPELFNPKGASAPRRASTPRTSTAPAAGLNTSYLNGRTMADRLRAYKEARGLA